MDLARRIKDVEVIADHAVKSIVNGVCGANEEDCHYIDVNPDRDYRVSRYEDLRFIQEGDPSPDGQGKVLFATRNRGRPCFQVRNSIPVKQWMLRS